MFCNLLFQSIVVPPPCHEVTQSREKLPQSSHDKSSAFSSKNRPMIPAVWFQSRTSACNCLRPSCVRRCNRALLLQLQQHRIESALIHGKHVSADLLDSSGDSVAVQRP